MPADTLHSARDGTAVLHLAKLEMRSLLMALTRRVKRFHIEAEERVLNNILRGFSKLIVTVSPELRVLSFRNLRSDRSFALHRILMRDGFA
jgi:hypothetical protein